MIRPTRRTMAGGRSFRRRGRRHCRRVSSWSSSMRCFRRSVPNEAVGLTRAYLQAGSEGAPLIQTPARAACKLDDDPHTRSGDARRSGAEGLHYARRRRGEVQGAGRHGGQAHDLLLRWRHLGHGRSLRAAPARLRRPDALRRVNGGVGEGPLAADRDRLVRRRGSGAPRHPPAIWGRTKTSLSGAMGSWSVSW